MCKVTLHFKRAGTGYVALYTTPNPFLLNAIDLNMLWHISWIYNMNVHKVISYFKKAINDDPKKNKMAAVA